MRLQARARLSACHHQAHPRRRQAHPAAKHIPPPSANQTQAPTRAQGAGGVVGGVARLPQLPPLLLLICGRANQTHAAIRVGSCRLLPASDRPPSPPHTSSAIARQPTHPHPTDCLPTVRTCPLESGAAIVRRYRACVWGADRRAMVVCWGEHESQQRLEQQSQSIQQHTCCLCCFGHCCGAAVELEKQSGGQRKVCVGEFINGVRLRIS